ncbi:putative proteasome endopeptidase complex [Dioscorea sansibarensis]
MGSQIWVSALRERSKRDLWWVEGCRHWANNQAAQSMLKHDCNKEIAREEVVQLALKVLSKTMFSRTILTSEKLELREIFLGPSGEVNY